ncbi:MAG TPA: malto-oligosyltrehalose synthase [Ohtaekwangia sp.]|nr:malto-oligosyltrehalose synthase [Ohtaekwangia sp.]
MLLPAATYRIQFNKDFSFRQLREIIDYLDMLGITTVYASPVFSAVPESMHGYDVTDPHMINPEIGSEEELRSISAGLNEKKMTWLQDIVPNHMAFSDRNFRLMDVLERGDRSEYFQYFDVDWKHPSKELYGKIMVPFLGKELHECIADREIILILDQGGLTIRYFDSAYPLSIPAYDYLLKETTDNALREQLGAIIAQAQSADYHEWRSVKENFFNIATHGPGRKEIDRILAVINSDHEKLKHLLMHCHYALTYWKRTEQEINYRRFFTVNALICLRMEDENVFRDYHTYAARLWKEKLIHGFRIDHIDGLYDPKKYISQLRQATNASAYIIAEKILEAEEQLPEQWPLEGTSGYEFLAYTNQLFTNRKGARVILRFYRELVPDLPRYEKLVQENKEMILSRYMAGEWSNLANYFFELQLQSGYAADRTRHAIGLVMLSMPVYRIYPDSFPLRGIDLDILVRAFNEARRWSGDYKPELDYLQSLFTGPPVTADEGERILLFLKRMMQFTGPLTAKGVEDTTFYVYNPLISHDEVGDEPSTLGISIQEFHRKMIQRQANTPLSLNATATHDTKRGEDARLRLNILSGIPETWLECVKQWLSVNDDYHTLVNDQRAPTLNDEFFIYQALVGGFPHDLKITDEFVERIQAYLTKVVREAKVNSAWEAPNEAYENACNSFISGILRADSDFLHSFYPLIQKVIYLAGRSALGQTLLKITAPGIPDTYQGTELWDLSFVDPDNRRPVDYHQRKTLLEGLAEKEKQQWLAVAEYLGIHRSAGAEKLFVTWKALNFRKAYPELFVKGDYEPLPVSGADVIAYARRHANLYVVVIIPLGIAALQEEYGDATIRLPEGYPRSFRNIFSDEPYDCAGDISIGAVLSNFPVALLHGAT